MSVKVSAKYNTTAKLRAAVAGIGNRIASIRNDIQSMGVAALVHAQEHGDWTILRDLVANVTKCEGVYKTKLTLWAQHATGAALEEDEKGLRFVWPEGKGVKGIDPEVGASINWWEMKSPKRDTSKDIDEIRTALAKMLVASAKADKVEVGLTTQVMAAFDFAVDLYANPEEPIEFSEDELAEQLRAIAA